MLGHSPTSLECPFHRWRNRVGGLWGVIQIHDGHYLDPSRGQGRVGSPQRLCRSRMLGRGRDNKCVTPTSTCCFFLQSPCEAAEAVFNILPAPHSYSFLAPFGPQPLPHLPPCTSSHETLVPGSSSPLETKNQVGTADNNAARPCCATPSVNRGMRSQEVAKS